MRIWRNGDREPFEQKGLKANRNKRKHMIVDIGENNDDESIKLKNDFVKEVADFKYIDAMMRGDGKNDEEVRRYKQGRQAGRK